jgi:ubiquitin-protein ligase
MAATGVSLALQPPQELPRRIIKETERIQKAPIPGISAIPKADNPRHFDISIQGPKGTCYEGKQENYSITIC